MKIIKKLKNKNNLKKFWVYIIGGIGICFLLTVVINKITEKERIKQIITYCQNSNAIKEKEIIDKFYYTPISLTSETKNKLESKLKRKFWKEYFFENFLMKLWDFEMKLENFLEKFEISKIILHLKSLASSLTEAPILSFYVDGEYVISFLKKTKIYKVRVKTDEGCGFAYRRFIVGVQNGDKIFNLTNLKEINKLIKEEKIWLDTSSKAIKYATLLIELTAECPIEIINLLSFEKFIKEFIIGPCPYGRYSLDERGKWVSYKTVQEYARSFPKKYQELLKYKNKIEESPRIIKETKYNYEIMLSACETLGREVALTELKLTIYRNGEINLKKKYLVRKIKERLSLCSWMRYL